MKYWCLLWGMAFDISRFLRIIREANVKLVSMFANWCDFDAHTITLGVVESHLRGTSTDEFASAGLASTPVIHWVGVTVLTTA